MVKLPGLPARASLRCSVFRAGGTRRSFSPPPPEASAGTRIPPQPASQGFLRRRVNRRGWWIAAFLLVLAGGWWWRQASAGKNDQFGELPAFSMEAAWGDGQGTVSKASLSGRVWVAGFIFVHCSGPCPMVSQVMARLQTRLPNKAVLVTFTVDPDRDSLDVLKRYAKSWEADPARWWFVRGEKKEVYRLMYEGFKLPLVEDPDAPSGFRVTHSVRLVLVDQQGKVRGYYSSNDEEALKALEHDAARLIGEKVS